VGARDDAQLSMVMVTITGADMEVFVLLKVEKDDEDDCARAPVAAARKTTASVLILD